MGGLVCLTIEDELTSMAFRTERAWPENDTQGGGGRRARHGRADGPSNCLL